MTAGAALTDDEVVGAVFAAASRSAGMSPNNNINSVIGSSVTLSSSSPGVDVTKHLASVRTERARSVSYSGSRRG